MSRRWSRNGSILGRSPAKNTISGRSSPLKIGGTPYRINDLRVFRRTLATRNEFFRRGEESFGGEDFRRFFGQPPGFDRDRSGERNEDQDEQERTPLAATGTGFDDDGLILTNNHVVENATSIQIQFYGDDERYAARVLGRDRLTDSALLELVERPARKLPAARFGDSSRMAPGDWVMAIGAPPLVTLPPRSSPSRGPAPC